MHMEIPFFLLIFVGANWINFKVLEDYIDKHDSTFNDIAAIFVFAAVVILESFLTLVAIFSNIGNIK